MTSSALISAAELADRLADPANRTRVLDVRWSLSQPDGTQAHAAGHVPGAVYVDLETQLSDHSLVNRGRHPLPTAKHLQESLQEWGISDHDSVVVYDDWNAAGSSRARWVLRAAGFGDVVILDGGWQAWQDAGLPIETGPVTPEPGVITTELADPEEGLLPTLTADDAAYVASNHKLLDARAPERFSGEVEPIDAVGGHIPGAINVPSGQMLDAGKFRSAEELKALFGHAFGEATEVGAYCGSGVTAAVVLTALEIAGYENAALYPGSWSEWTQLDRA